MSAGLSMPASPASKAISMTAVAMVAEMRRIFDEATGITRYKVRRKEALRRLIDARQDRERALDILSEVEKQANSSKRQVARVRAYKRLQDKILHLKSVIVLNVLLLQPGLQVSSHASFD